MPLTDLGYIRPTYDELLAAQTERAKLLFGEDIDTNDNTPLGKYIRINVADLADVYEDIEKVYFARFPNTSTGVSLDRLCPFVGIARNPATYAQHNVRFIGTAGEHVPAAFEVSTTDGALTFHTYESLLIGEDGTVEGLVECEQAGTIGNVSMGRIDTILNPDANVESIEHLGIAQLGEDIEDDSNLRYRFNQTILGAGSATVAAIKAAILKVPLVDGAEIVENNTAETVDGMPPNSFECFVLSPESQDELVAKAIFNKKPIGIKTHGDLDVDIVDENGVTHTVSFSRTIEKKVYIKLNISTNIYFEENGVEQIKNNIIQYINALKNGGNVYLSSLYGYVYKAAGVVNVSSLTISTDGSTYGTSDIEVESNEVARTSEAIIEVVVSA